MLSAFVSENPVRPLRPRDFVPNGQPDRLDNVVLLSTEAFHMMQTGRIYFQVRTWDKHPDTTLIQTVGLPRTTNMLLSSLMGESSITSIRMTSDLNGRLAEYGRSNECPSKTDFQKKRQLRMKNCYASMRVSRRLGHGLTPPPALAPYLILLEVRKHPPYLSLV